MSKNMILNVNFLVVFNCVWHRFVCIIACEEVYLTFDLFENMKISTNNMGIKVEALSGQNVY